MLPTDEAFYVANHCYGYGRWDALYWFIGLEEGQTKNGTDTVATRSKVSQDLAEDGLCDIRRFHNHPEIDEKWFKGINPPTQTTWRYLIMALKAYLNEDVGLENIREYQRINWGSSLPTIGETCVIELSGIAANSLKEPRNRNLFRQQRIDFIHQKLLKHAPKFVLIYGKHQHEHWAQVAADLKEKACTQVKFAESPTARTAKGKSKKEYWTFLGQELRESSVA